MKTMLFLFFMGSIWAGLAVSAVNHNSFAARERLTSKQVAAALRNPESHQLFVVGHRADGVGASENSLEAVRNSIRAGVPVVEIDVRLSQDGEVFLLHNHRLNKMTNGRGPIEMKTARQLERLRLPDGQRLPKFCDVYEAARGQAMMVIHFKENAVAQVAKCLEEKGSFDDAIFYLSTAEQLAAAAPVKARHPEMLIMVSLRSVQEAQLFSLLYGYRPDIVNLAPYDRNLAEQLHQRGYKIYSKAKGMTRFSRANRAEAIKKMKDQRIDLVLINQPLLILE
jgi:glycerophosphoryl diester phosphodiesterase